MKISTLTLNPALDKSLYIDDEFIPCALNRASQSSLQVGGKGINISRVLKNLGVDAICYGFSGGLNGKTMCELLDIDGIKYRLAKTAAETRLNVKLTDIRGCVTEINEPGGPVSDDELAELEKLLDDDNSDTLVIAGSIPLGLDSDTYALLIEKMKRKGKKVIVDCDGDALKNAVTASPDLIKPNKQELAMYLGSVPATEREIALECRKIYEKSGARVLCTMGEDGALYVGDEGIYRAKVPDTVRNGRVCAGDTFLAGYLYTLETSGSVEQALAFASSAATAKVEKEGTLFPDKEHMYKYLNEVSVEKILCEAQI